MIIKNIAEVTEQDLQDLVDNSVLESKTLEYKQSLTVIKDLEKKEFLADVSSFANASGGDLIYGISQDRNTGAPKSLDGLSIPNIDQEITRLENIIRDGIRPRIPSITQTPITLSNTNNIALIIRVPRSWNKPHRVVFKNDGKFHARNSNGKYLLDVGELRIMFNLSETLAEKIRNFREGRISTIVANEGPVPLVDNPKILLHLIPLDSFTPGQRCNLDNARNLAMRMRPMHVSGYDYRYNLDGFLTYSYREDAGSHSYVQLFRNGIIEAVDGATIGPQKSLPSVAFVNQLTESLEAYLDLMSSLAVETPIFLFLSLLDVRGCVMAVGGPFRERNAIDRDMLLLPEVIIENYDMPVDDILRPCFDSIWNACGFPRCPNYDETGKRNK